MISTRRAPRSSYNQVGDMKEIIKLHEFQPGERLAPTPEQHPALSLVTGFSEARGTGYWAATQVKVSSSEIILFRRLTRSSTWKAVFSLQLWQCNENPAESKSVARYQNDCMGTWESQCIPFRMTGQAYERQGRTRYCTLAVGLLHSIDEIL